jgi:hypothetical protein
VNTPQNDLLIEISLAATRAAQSGQEPRVVKLGDQQVALLWPHGHLDATITDLVVADWGTTARHPSAEPRPILTRRVALRVERVPKSSWLDVHGG